jgi:hypothetical protein
MQKDWNDMGSSAFSYEFLEECEPLKCEIREGELIKEFGALDPIEGYNSIEVASKGHSGAKRGPKPSGIAKVVYYRRVPAEWVDRLDAFISTNGAVRDVGYTKTPTISPNGLESKGMGGYGPAVDSYYSKLSDDLKAKCVEVVKPDVEFELIKKQLDQMTKSYEEEFSRAENLLIDLGNLRDELDKVAGWSDDEKVRYWRNRAFVAEGAKKTNEFDQG